MRVRLWGPTLLPSLYIGKVPRDRPCPSRGSCPGPVCGWLQTYGHTRGLVWLIGGKAEGGCLRGGFRSSAADVPQALPSLWRSGVFFYVLVSGGLVWWFVWKMPVDFFGIGIFGRGDLHVCGCGGWFAFVVYVGVDKGGVLKDWNFVKC